MTRSSQLNHSRIHRLAVTGMVLGILLGIIPITLAHNVMSAVASVHTTGTLVAQAQRSPYTPPPPNRTRSSSTTGGVRGQCSGQSNLSLLALAPHSHVGQSSSTRPTFAWFVPEEESYDLVFQLLQEGIEDPLYDVSMPSRAGMMTWSLPDNEPALKVGETYRWRVIMICDRNRPSRSPRDGAALVVMAAPQQVTANRSVDPLTYANQTAANGFWYDALAATLTDPNEAQLRLLQVGLLTDLAQIEATTNPQRAESWQSMIETLQ